METDQQKNFLIAAIAIAVAFHIAAFYAIGWIGLSSNKQPGKVLIPVTMQINPLNKTIKPTTSVPIKHIPRVPVHPIKPYREIVKTGHNKFLASAGKPNHGFSVPAGGHIKAGTGLTHQGTSATSSSASNNVFLPPIPIFNPMPLIPTDMRAHTYNTSVRVEFFVNKDASFTSRLLSSTGYDELDRAVINTLKKWKFSPATMDGQPVHGTLKLRIRFSVD
jgi:protein TonB